MSNRRINSIEVEIIDILGIVCIFFYRDNANEKTVYPYKSITTSSWERLKRVIDSIPLTSLRNERFGHSNIITIKREG